jgi:DNA polymerase/3'-5' exonuclease PolX
MVVNINERIIDQFKLLVKQIEFDIDYTTGKVQMVNMYRLGAIIKVIKILEKFKTKITTSEQLKGIKNLGKKSLERIDEILKTGKLSEIKIDENAHKYLAIIDKLESIIGIGRKKAYDLFKNYNIQSIEDLKDKLKKHEIELPENIIKGIKYIDQIKDNIPRHEIDQLSKILMQGTRLIDPELFGIVCGSYRREQETSGDVDFIITHNMVKTKKDRETHNYLEQFVKYLKKENIIIESLTSDNVPTKYMGIYKLKDGPLRRIDIRYIEYDSYYSAILYFTGSKDFNKKMRLIAIEMGYTLNEYGLFNDKNKRFSINSEKDIFDLLNMEYLTPIQRI